jgi:hypothetical protein
MLTLSRPRRDRPTDPDALHVGSPPEPRRERDQPVALTRRSSQAAARPHVGDPPATNSISREPQLPQRRRSRTSGTSPRPTVIRSARSASQRGGTLCTRHVLSSPYGLPSGASGGVRVCPVPRHRRPPRASACGPGDASTSPTTTTVAALGRYFSSGTILAAAWSSRFPASDVVADQQHVLMIDAPRPSQITARRCEPARFTGASSAARSILPEWPMLANGTVPLVRSSVELTRLCRNGAV